MLFERWRATGSDGDRFCNVGAVSGMVSCVSNILKPTRAWERAYKKLTLAGRPETRAQKLRKRMGDLSGEINGGSDSGAQTEEITCASSRATAI